MAEALSTESYLFTWLNILVVFSKQYPLFQTISCESRMRISTGRFLITLIFLNFAYKSVSFGEEINTDMSGINNSRKAWMLFSEGVLSNWQIYIWNNRHSLLEVGEFINGSKWSPVWVELNLDPKTRIASWVGLKPENELYGLRCSKVEIDRAAFNQPA